MSLITDLEMVRRIRVAVANLGVDVDVTVDDGIAAINLDGVTNGLHNDHVRAREVIRRVSCALIAASANITATITAPGVLSSPLIILGGQPITTSPPPSGHPWTGLTGVQVVFWRGQSNEMGNGLTSEVTSPEGLTMVSSGYPSGTYAYNVSSRLIVDVAGAVKMPWRGTIISGTFDTALSFAHMFRSANPAATLIIVCGASGNSSINVANSSGVRWGIQYADSSMLAMKTALDDIKAAYPSANFLGDFGWSKEADAGGGIGAAAWGLGVARQLQFMRAIVPGIPTVGLSANMDYAPTMAAINAAALALPTSIRNVSTVDMSDISGSTDPVIGIVHNDGEGVIQAGIRAWDAFADAIANTTPHAIAPPATSATHVSLSAAPGGFTINVSALPDAASAIEYAMGQFEVSVNGGASWASLYRASTITMTGYTPGSALPVSIRAMNEAGRGGAYSALITPSALSGISWSKIFQNDTASVAGSGDGMTTPWRSPSFNMPANSTLVLQVSARTPGAGDSTAGAELIINGVTYAATLSLNNSGRGGGALFVVPASAFPSGLTGTYAEVRWTGTGTGTGISYNGMWFAAFAVAGINTTAPVVASTSVSAPSGATYAGTKSITPSVATNAIVCALAQVGTDYTAPAARPSWGVASSDEIAGSPSATFNGEGYVLAMTLATGTVAENRSFTIPSTTIGTAIPAYALVELASA